MRVIAGIFKGRLLKSPKSTSTRPTQSMLREAVFNICQNEIQGARFLDLFAGSGAMGIEALSRNASHATFVEQNRQAIHCIKENLETLQIDKQARLIPMDASRAIKLLVREGAQFDLIYIDPPYDMGVELSSIAPLLAKTGALFLEERHKGAQSKDISGLTVRDQKRFGTALLTIFSWSTP